MPMLKEYYFLELTSTSEEMSSLFIFRLLQRKEEKYTDLA